MRTLNACSRSAPHSTLYRLLPSSFLPPCSVFQCYCSCCSEEPNLFHTIVYCVFVLPLVNCVFMSPLRLRLSTCCQAVACICLAQVRYRWHCRALTVVHARQLDFWAGRGRCLCCHVSERLFGRRDGFNGLYNFYI